MTTIVGGFSDLTHLEELAECASMGPLSVEEQEKVRQVWSRNFDLA